MSQIFLLFYLLVVSQAYHWSYTRYTDSIFNIYLYKIQVYGMWIGVKMRVMSNYKSTTEPSYSMKFVMVYT